MPDRRGWLRQRRLVHAVEIIFAHTQMDAVHVTMVDRGARDEGVVAKESSPVDDKEVILILPVADGADLLAVGVVDRRAWRVVGASCAHVMVRDIYTSLLIHALHPFCFVMTL